MSQFQLTTFAKGQSIFTEGAEGTMAYLIRSGSVVIHRTAGEEEIILAHLQPGEVFGEMALVTTGRRTASATAATEVELVLMPEAPFREQVQQMSPLVSELFTAMAQRLENTSRQVRSARTKHPVSSVCRIVKMLLQGRNSLAVRDVVDAVQEILDLTVHQIHVVFDQMASHGLVEWRKADGTPAGTLHFPEPLTFNVQVERFIDSLPESGLEALTLKGSPKSQQAAETIPMLDITAIESNHGVSTDDLRRWIGDGSLSLDLLRFSPKATLQAIMRLQGES